MMKRKFKNIEIDESKRPTRWRPDTCDCVVIYDKDGKFLDEENCCKLHMGLKKEKLLNEIKKHNKSFNEKYAEIENPTKEQIAEVLADKAKEKKRISAL